jgi:hypothetical protein
MVGVYLWIHPQTRWMTASLRAAGCRCRTSGIAKRCCAHPPYYAA